MNRICVGTILAAAGSASAQPVARQLIADADALKVLHTEQSVPTAAVFASLHTLEDLDHDGVREVLLTHTTQVPTPGVFDLFTAVIHSPAAGKNLLTLASEDATAIRLAHTAAVMIDDINGDGVRDLAAARALANRLELRVHSGADGTAIRVLSYEDTGASVGFSMLPWEDIDGDGQRDLIVSRGPDATSSAPFLAWSPGSGVVSPFRPEGYTLTLPLGYVAGYALLDLGLGPNGDRRMLSSAAPDRYLSGQPVGSLALIDVFGNKPLALEGSYFPFDANSAYPTACVLGDLTGDGFNEVIIGGFYPAAEGPIASVAVLNVAIPPMLGGMYEPIATQSPRIIADFGNGPEMVQVGPTDGLIALDDATGDGFPDYAFVTGLGSGMDVNRGALVAVCGRTGRAFFAASHLTPSPEQETLWARPYIRQIGAGRDAFVSPGDINNDGAPDILVLVVRTDYGDGSADPIREQLLLTHYLPTPCAGDTDFDRVVNFSDLNAVLSNFGAQDITLPADLNADGVVNFADLNLVLSSFGTACD